MRVLVCGGRDFLDEDVVFTALDRLDQESYVSVIIHGGASGADSLAHAWAKKRDVNLVIFPVPPLEWRRLGPAAGPIRNARMLKEGRPELVVGFPGNRGTSDMVKRSLAAKVPTAQVDRKGAVRGSGAKFFSRGG